MSEEDTPIIQLCNASKNGQMDLVEALLSSDKTLSNQNHHTHKRKPIHYAAREGHNNIVLALLEAGANPLDGVHAYGPDTQPINLAKDRGHQDVVETIENWLNRTRGTSTIGKTITQAVQVGDLKKLEEILEINPASINETNSRGNTALHVAVSTGRPTIVQWLISRGADIDARNSHHQKPIHIALHKNATTPGDGVIAGILIAAGTEVDIWVATAIGDQDAIKAWLKYDPKLANWNNGANLNPRGAAFPLTIAAKLNDVETVNLLLDAGADPNAALLTKDGPSEYPDGYPSSGAPLHCAIANGHIELAHLLLDRGARADAPPEYAGNAPIDIACDLGNQDLINRMVTEGARPLLGKIIGMKNYIALAEIIDRHDAPPSPIWIRKEGYENPLRRILLNAVRSGTLPVVRMCLNNGASIENLEDLLYQCMHHAKPSGSYLEVFKALIDYGADPNFKGPEHTTPLHFVATIARGISSENRIAFAQALLENGAGINPIDTEMDSTPLGWAARFGRLELVRFLLNQGADPSLPQGSEWATPLSWAIKKGHVKVVELLLKS